MNAISTRYGAGFAETAPRPRPRASSPADSPRGAQARGTVALRLGLQLSRANAMALTRLQLALCTGERRQALEAIDRLHTLDAKLERVVAQLDAAPADGEGTGGQGTGDQAIDDQAIYDQDWAALSTHLADQKLALAFEKLALASGITGPDLTSASPLPAQGLAPRAGTPASAGPSGPATDARAAAEPEPEPALDWHAFPALQPTEWNPFANRTFTVLAGIALALVVTALLAGAVVMLAGA